MRKLFFIGIISLMSNIAVAAAMASSLVTEKATPIMDGITKYVDQNIEQEKDPFAIFPNPTTGGFVTIQSKFDTPKEVTIYDILGKEIIRTVLKDDKLDISLLESGIYMLKIIQGQASVTKKLIVK